MIEATMKRTTVQYRPHTLPGLYRIGLQGLRNTSHTQTLYAASVWGIFDGDKEGFRKPSHIS